MSLVKYLLALRLPGIMFREEELIFVVSSEVALFTVGTEALSWNTRVISVTTDPDLYWLREKEILL